MMLWIMCKSYSTLIVTINDILVADVVADLSEKAKELDLLLKSVKESYVFQFGAGEGDCRLSV